MIGDRYLLRGLYRQGTQGKLWKAQDKLTGANRIIKTGKSVKYEAVLSRRLVHPLIGYAYDYGLDPEHGDFSVYPEFLGKNVLEWISGKKNATLKQFALKATEFLSFIHHRGWLYNDFKPEHFLMTEKGLKVIDLGLCSPLKEGSSSGTFSGTFPYISPERLNGRSFDQRSDIFALGILLLHLLFPEENVPSDPSLDALNTLIGKVDRLKDPWKKTISQMTALEPSQRISNAQELARRLQSANEETTPSYPATISLPVEILQGKMLLIHSPSQMMLDAAHNQVLISSWEQERRVYSFNCKQISPEQSFEKLCFALTGRRTDSAYAMLQALKQKGEGTLTVVVYENPEALTAAQRAMLFFGLSCLGELDWIKLVIYSTQPLLPGLPESWGKFFIPLEEGFSAKTSMESIDPAGRKILHALALAGGSLALSVLESFSRPASLNKLEQSGLIVSRDHTCLLVVPVDSVLSRIRPGQKRQAAARILRDCNDSIESSALFHLAWNAQDRKLAAKAALLEAEKHERAESRSERMEWLWNAFVCGAELPRKLLFELTKYYLLRGRGQRSKSLLKHIRKRFGLSFRYADYYLDYYHRRHKVEPAIALVDKCIEAARTRKKENVHFYFVARRAGLFVLQNDFDHAEELLAGLENCQTPSVMGLRHHFRGLLLFHRGDLDRSLREYQEAGKFTYRFRKSTSMNIGVVLGKMGRFHEAQQSLNKAISVFSKYGDQVGLSRSFQNTGMNFLTAGDVTRARMYFIKSLYLSRASGNPSVYIMTLNNLAVTYEMEGRNDKALTVLSKVHKLAKRFHFMEHVTYALSNMGLHLAYAGKFRDAVSMLKQAIRMRSSLKLNASLGRAYEYLGITHYLARHLVSSEKALVCAQKLFRDAGSLLDTLRTDLFLSLVYLQKKKLELSEKIPCRTHTLSDNSFELGLYYHANAQKAMYLGDPRSALRQVQEAERIFRKVPALFWLAKNHKLKSEIYRKSESIEKSFLSLQAAYNLFSRLGSRYELRNLPKEGRNMKLYDDFLNRLAERLPYKALQMVKEILTVDDIDSMVEKILHTALDLTSMDRAMLVLKDEPPRVFRSASLDESNLSDLLEISRSVLDSASDSGKPVVCLDALSDPLLQNRPSILNNRILSVVCLPLKGSNGQTVGYLYLDSREGVETLAGTEKILLEIFSSIIGLVLSQSLVLEKSIRENRKLRDWLELRKECPEMIGTSQAVADVLRTVQKVLNHNLPILITGETGTGKELVARILHYSGSRKKGPFVAVNCAAFSRELLESELFGHERGSFTGAFQQKKGVFEQAINGTLLLDEIGEMPLEMQAKLLRVLQGGEYRRIGGTATLSTDARVLLSTNRNLDEMVQQGKFREDLLYRIKVLEIHLPALRDRVEDIPLLSSAFLKEAAMACGKQFLGFTQQAFHVMKAYPWPGNVRQLKSEIERAAALSDADWIDVADLDPRIAQVFQADRFEKLSAGTLAGIEKNLIISRLEESQWNVVSAAKSLGITRHGLYSKMKRYRVSNPNKA